MKPKVFFIFFSLLLMNCLSSGVKGQLPPIPATRLWTGAGDGHTWTQPTNWNGVYCTSPTGVVSLIYTVPITGEIVEFNNTGNISVTNCPIIKLGNTPYNSYGYYNCGGGSSSQINLYSMQINPFSYVTLDNIIVAGGSVGQSAGTNIATALEIQEGRLTCPGLSGNFGNLINSPLNTNSIRAENSIIQITNPGTGGSFSPSGRSSFTNCTITCTQFSPNSNNTYPSEKDVFTGCTVNTGNVSFGPKCIAELHNSTINLSGSTFSLNGSATINSVILDNVQINSSSNTQLNLSFRDNFVMKGNIACQSTNSTFQLAFQSLAQNCVGPGGTSPCYDVPKIFKVDGNITFNGGALRIQNCNLDVTGNLELNGIPNPNLTKTVKINNQPVMSIGASGNFVNYGGFYGPIPGLGQSFGISFSGNSDSHIKWPIAFPADTFTIAKTNCAKVYFDTIPLYVTGKLQIKSGQLVLSPHNQSIYSLVDDADLIINDGGSISLESSADIALGGNFVDSNTVTDPLVCKGFNNPTNNTLSFFSGQFSPVSRLIGSAGNVSVGHVKLISSFANPFTLQNNLITTNFDLGTNGNVGLGNYDLSINGSILNSSSSKYFATTGTGKLKLKDVGLVPRLFPIGSSFTNYNPVTITNTGVVDNYFARVSEHVYTGITDGLQLTRNVVDKTWFIDEGTAGGSNTSITLQWAGPHELPGFTRNSSYIGGYLNGSWQLGNVGSAVGSNPYTLTRSGITGLSAFVVANNQSAFPVYNLNSDLWSNSSSWSNGQIPNVNSIVHLNFDVIVDINASCSKLIVQNHSVTIQTGKNLTVTNN